MSENEETKNHNQYNKPKVTLLQRLAFLVVAILVIVVIYHFFIA